MLALLVLGSATLLFSCSSKPAPVEYDVETLMTELSENRTITMTENGERSYTFAAPLIEGYSLAQNPYQEFRKGIKMTTYTSDSLSLVDATITANYAIYYDKQKLWEAKGDVVILKRNRKGSDTTVVNLTEVYTQQLFWDARTKKIYSNVDTKVLQPDGWHFGVGFEADEDLKNIHFRKYKSEMEFDFSPVEEAEEGANSQEVKDNSGDKKVAPKDSNKERREPKGRPSDRGKSTSKPSAREFNPSSMPKKESTAPATHTRPNVQNKNVQMSSAVSTNVTMSTSTATGRSERPNNLNREKTLPTGTKK